MIERLRRVFSKTHGPLPIPASQPPAALDPDEIAERQAARRRLEPKWQAIDGLIADFERGDRRLGLRR